MFCKINVFKNFAKFTGKHLCQSIAFNEVASWKDSQNLQENTCAGVSFLKKAAGWKHNISIKLLIHLHFFIASLWQNRSLLYHLHSERSLLSDKNSNCLHSSNIISNIGSCGDRLVCKKQLKIKRDKDPWLK